MDHHMIERAVVATARRRPAVHHVGAQVGNEFAGRQFGVPAGDLVRQTAEVEVAVAQLGHELLFGVAGRHGQVRDHLANPPALTQGWEIPLRIGGGAQQVGEGHELGGYSTLQVGVIRQGQLHVARTVDDRHQVRRTACAKLIGPR